MNRDEKPNADLPHASREHDQRKCSVTGTSRRKSLTEQNHNPNPCQSFKAVLFIFAGNKRNRQTTETVSTSNYFFRLIMRNKQNFHTCSEGSVYCTCWLLEMWSQRHHDRHLCNPSWFSSSRDSSGRASELTITSHEPRQQREQHQVRTEPAVLWRALLCPGFTHGASAALPKRSHSTRKECGYTSRVRNRGRLQKASKVKATGQTCAWDFGEGPLKHCHSCTRS